VALNLTQVFTSLGRAGRNAYIVNGAQVLQPVPLNELVALAYVNPAWVTGLVASYDSNIRTETSSMGSWVNAAQIILQNLVTADNPTYGTSLPLALFYLNQQMQAQGASVQSCTVTEATLADPANVGNGNLVVVLTRADGLLFQNVVAEPTTLAITADSYTGGATRGQEPWAFAGKPNVSSLNTGVRVGLWDWDWPQGSGVTTTGACVAANAYSQSNGNLLTNGDWLTWTGSPAAPNNWNLVVGTWGTSIQQESVNILGGTYSVRFNAGATLNELTQQFSSSTTTGASAGTGAAAPPYTTITANLWLKAAGVISGGVMTVKLVDGSGTTINDQAGTPNSTTIALTAHSTSWVAHEVTFRLPIILPSAVRLDIKITTALAGANLYMDWVAAAVPTNLYPGGPNVTLYSNPAAPFEAAPDPDAYTLTFTNNRGGATYGATWQTLISRLFQTPGLILPYSGAPTILDTLITGV
jgi:hypothetical protein